MEFSIQLLLERADFYGKILRKRISGKRYRELAIYTGEEEKLQPETLYISDGWPTIANAAENAGFVILCSNPPSDKALPCEYVCLPKEGSYGQIYNQLNRTLSKLQAQMTLFFQKAARGVSLQQLIEQLYDIFRTPAYLVNSSLQVVAIDRRMQMRELSATWKRLEDYGYMPLDLADNLIKSSELHRMESGSETDIIHSRYFYTPFINCNLRYKGKIQGHLFIVGMLRKIQKSDLELSKMCAEIITKAMIQNGDKQYNRGNIYENFLKTLFESRIADRDYFTNQIKHLKLPDHTYYMIGIFQKDDYGELEYERLASRLERFPHIWLAQYEDHITALFGLRGTQLSEEDESRLNKLIDSFTCEIGLSDIFEDLYDTSVYVQQAYHALTIKMPGRLPHSPVHYEDVFLLHILDLVEGEREIFTASEIRRIQHHDKNHKTDYAYTLTLYLLNNLNTRDTAHQLNIHRNTLLYRLDRMREVFGINLNQSNRRLRYLLNLLAEDMLRT